MEHSSGFTILERASRAGLQAALAAGAGKLGEDQISACTCLYDRAPTVMDPGAFGTQPVWEYRGTTQIYPASVCKMFYLAAVAAFEAQGRITLNDEDRRAVKAMIDISSNDATTYVLGRLTGAFDGPCLDDGALEAWLNKRQAVQTWLNTLDIPDLAGISLLHSTYEDSPYGCARQARTVRPANQLSARACAAMLHEMLRGALPGRDWMAAHMDRNWQRRADDPEGDQLRGFLGQSVPAEFNIWSKAGHTSWTRHDVLCAEAPDGRACMIAVMTEGHWTAQDETVLPAFADAFIKTAFVAQSS